MEQTIESEVYFRAKRGVEKHHLFDCLGRLRERDREELNATYGKVWNDDLLSKVWTKGQADGLTIWAGETIAACIVSWEILPGQWTCGMMMTDDWPQIAKPASKYVRRYLRPVLLGQRVRRLSCVVDAKHLAAQRWLDFLGFRFEGRMQSYGTDGRDFLMMALLPNPTKQGEK